MFKERSENEAKATSLINEMIGNQKVVKAFAYENEAIESFCEANARLEKTTLNAIFFSSLVNPTTRFINSLVYAAVALVGALIAISASGGGFVFTIGELSCLLSYTNQYTKPFNEISGVIAEFQNALASASRVLELVEAEPEVSDEGGIVLDSALGNVELSDVSFSYTENKPLI